MGHKLKLSINGSFKLSKELIVTQLGPLLGLLILGCLLSIQIEDAIHTLTQDQESHRWMMQLGLGLWDLFEGIMVFLILSWGIAKIKDLRPPNFESDPFHQKYVMSFLAEYLRLLAQVLLYFILLVVPAIVRYCRLIFVPYIALFSKQYREGEVDALQLSAELTKRFFWTILTFFILTTMAQAGIEFLPNLVTELHTAPFRLLFMAISFYLSIWSYCFVYILFEEALKEKTWT